MILWRAGLRIQEALSLTELDLDRRRGSVLVRCGKGGRRREIGMDVWGFEHVHQLRHAHAIELAREGVPLNIIQRQLGHQNSA